MFDVNYDFFLIENNFKEIEEVKSEKRNWMKLTKSLK